MKVTVMEMGNELGTVEWTGGEFAIHGSGPEDVDYLRFVMDEIQQKYRVSGDQAIAALWKYFSGASHWIRWEPDFVKVAIHGHEGLLGTVAWIDGQYAVKGSLMSNEDLAARIQEVEQYSGLSGEDLLRKLPEYFDFDGSDKWANFVPV